MKLWKLEWIDPATDRRIVARYATIESAQRTRALVRQRGIVCVDPERVEIDPATIWAEKCAS